MSKEYTITISIPPATLSANSNAHYHTVGRDRKLLRAKVDHVLRLTYPCLIDAMWEKATIQYKFYFGCIRDRDDDNASSRMKSARDAFGPALYWQTGVRKGLNRGGGAGVIKNDSGFKELPVEMNIDRDNPRVEIVFKQIGGAE